MSSTNSTLNAKKKLEHYCAYQERCHDEVILKLRSMSLNSVEIDEVVVHLIENNFLNEERFACSFARGKFRIKKWGKIRIVNELKFRTISQYTINQALKEIDEGEYLSTFHSLSELTWNTITEKNKLKKRKKFCDYLLRKGWESNMIYEKVKEFEND
jgi:regulatory protein